MPYIKYTSIFVGTFILIAICIGAFSRMLNFDVQGMSFNILLVAIYCITSIIVVLIFFKKQKRVMLNIEIFKYCTITSVVIACMNLFVLMRTDDEMAMSFKMLSFSEMIQVAIYVIMMFVITIYLPIFVVNKILERKQ